MLSLMHGFIKLLVMYSFNLYDVHIFSIRSYLISIISSSKKDKSDHSSAYIYSKGQSRHGSVLLFNVYGFTNYNFYATRIVTFTCNLIWAWSKSGIILLFLNLGLESTDVLEKDMKSFLRLHDYEFDAIRLHLHINRN